MNWNGFGWKRLWSNQSTSIVADLPERPRYIKINLRTVRVSGEIRTEQLQNKRSENYSYMVIKVKVR
jgi:hypothetical protein